MWVKKTGIPVWRSRKQINWIQTLSTTLNPQVFYSQFLSPALKEWWEKCWIRQLHHRNSTYNQRLRRPRFAGGKVFRDDAESQICAGSFLLGETRIRGTHQPGMMSCLKNIHWLLRFLRNLERLQSSCERHSSTLYLHFKCQLKISASFFSMSEFVGNKTTRMISSFSSNEQVDCSALSSISGHLLRYITEGTIPYCRGGII